MLTITHDAQSLLKHILTRQDVPAHLAPRFVLEDEQLKLVLDQIHDEDRVFEFDGRPVLVLDEEVAYLLSDRTLITRRTEHGTEIALEEMEEGFGLE